MSSTETIGPTGGDEAFSRSSICMARPRWPCASMNPGTSARWPSSTTRVEVPINGLTADGFPTATMSSPRTATAVAPRVAGSTV